MGCDGQGYFQGPPVENEQLTQACQKMHFWGAHSLQWSGSVVIAYSFYSFVLEKIDDGNWPNLVELALDEFGQDLQKIAFIYHHSREDETQIIHYNCSVYHYGETMIVCAGSGEYRFIDEFDTNFDPEILQTNFQQMSMRLNHLYAKELHDPNAYFHGIGLAYEVGVLKGRCWEKAPYTLLVFSHNESSFGLKTSLSVFMVPKHYLCFPVGIGTKEIGIWKTGCTYQMNLIGFQMEI